MLTFYNELEELQGGEVMDPGGNRSIVQEEVEDEASALSSHMCKISCVLLKTNS